MSQAEELLNGMSEEVPVHTHPVPDTDTYFVIDPVTRKIENTNRKKNVIMQYDHNSERFTFELPRYIDGHDMLECTSVTVNVDNIEVIESDGIEEVGPRINSDAPDMTDLRVHLTDPEKVICSWLISRNSTQLAGILSFHIEFKCVDSNGNVVYEWSTDTFSDIAVKARKKNGEAAVVEHSDLLEQWRTRIFGAGDSVMANIEAEGKTQVAAVKAESETQQEAVELKGAQTLETIPEDYTEVDAMADEAVRSKSDAIVCEASAESIVLKDSSNDHIRGLKLFGKTTQVTTTGKNLIPSKKLNSVVTNGITFMPEYNSSGQLLCITVNGTAGDQAYISIVSTMNLPEGDYILSGCPSGGGLDTYGIRFNGVNARDYGDGARFTITSETAQATITCVISPGTTVHNLKFYPMIRLASVSDPTYEPYSGGVASPSPTYPQPIESVENPTVTIRSRNLFNGEISTCAFSGNAIVFNDTYRGFYLPIKPGKTYTVSRNVIATNRFQVMFTANEPVNNEKVYNRVPGDDALSITAIAPNNCNWLVCYLSNAGEDTSNVLYQVEEGSVAHTYEPYVESQILTLNRNIPGIPVTSGGNYTDSDGQQWICDEIDLERGVYMQRVKTETFDGNNTGQWWEYFSPGYEGYARTVPDMQSGVRWAGYSDMFKVHTGSSFDPGIWIGADNNVLYLHNVITLFPSLDYFKEWVSSNPFTVMYPLATPIETPLTAEEITAFKALRTNYPNTTILNDAGAWMSVKYNADTKSYVDKPKTLRLTDTSTGVVYELKVVDGNLTVVPVQ